MTTWQCAGCKKMWQAEEPPAECACGCRIVREVTVAPVEAKTPSTPEPTPVPVTPAVPAGPQPFWRRAQVQGMAAVCACLALAAAGWGGYAWHSERERRRAETEAYVFSSYQPSLDKAKALKAASPDRGEGFGPHLDALASACSGAEAAWGAKNRELCRTFLEKAQTEQRWLDEAVPGRAKAAAVRLKVGGERLAAEKEKASEYATTEWALANAAFTRADGLREKGEFASALAAYGESETGYKKTTECARAAHVAAAKAKFEGLFDQLSAKLDLLERDGAMTNLVVAAEKDVQKLKEETEVSKGFLPEADIGRLVAAETRFRRFRIRTDFLTSLAEVESRIKGLEGEGMTLEAITVAQKSLAALSAKSGQERESLLDADMERFKASDAAFKKYMQGNLAVYLKAATDKAGVLPEEDRAGVRLLLGRTCMVLGSETFAKEQWKLAEQDAVKTHSAFVLADMAERAYKQKDSGEYTRLIGLAFGAVTNTWAWGNIAEKQWKCEDMEGYRKSVEQATRNDGQKGFVFRLGTFAGNQEFWGDMDGMKATLRLARTVANGEFEILYVAKEQFRMGDRTGYEESVNVARQAAKESSDFRWLASGAWELGDRTAYETDLNKAVQLADGEFDIGMLAEECWKLGDRNGFSAVLQSGQERYKDTSAFCRYAELLFECGDRKGYAEMIEKAEQAVRRDSDFYLSSDFKRIGEKQWECGDREGYQQSLNKVTREDYRSELKALSAVDFGSVKFGSTVFASGLSGKQRLNYSALTKLVRDVKKTGDFQRVFDYAGQVEDLNDKGTVYGHHELYSLASHTGLKTGTPPPFPR